MASMCLALLAGCIPQPMTLPADAPGSLSAVPDNAAVHLAWAASTGAETYNVKRATTDGGPFAKIASATSSAYTDSSVTNGTTYYYVVSALNESGESGNSAQVTVTPAIPVAPAAPTGLTATVNDAQVNLAWVASAGAVSYRVKRSTTNGGPYTQIATPTAA